MAAEADRDELEAERMRGGCPKPGLRLTLLPQQRHIESHSGHLRENEESRSDVLQRQRDDERATLRRGANRGQYPVPRKWVGGWVHGEDVVALEEGV